MVNYFYFEACALCEKTFYGHLNHYSSIYYIIPVQTYITLQVIILYTLYILHVLISRIEIHRRMNPVISLNRCDK